MVWLMAPATGDADFSAEMPSRMGVSKSLPQTPVPQTLSKFSHQIVAGSQYERIIQIGRGAFSVVYESKEPKTGLPVALKVLDLHLKEAEQRMPDRELEILASIQHKTLLEFPGFVSFSLAPATNPPAIVTELRPHGSLQSSLDRALKSENVPNWTITS
jgi:serine/threonine protein kinase